MEEYDKVYSYLESGTYPEGLSKDGKRNWRCKCKEYFKIENGQLYHRKGERKPLNKQQEQPSACMEIMYQDKREGKNSEVIPFHCYGYVSLSVHINVSQSKLSLWFMYRRTLWA